MQLAHAIFQHALLAQLSGDHDDCTDGNGGNHHHAGELGADREAAEQTHLDL